MKIICPGLPKTGTKSMRKALEILGYENVHDVFEQWVCDYDIITKWKKGTAVVKDFQNAYKNVDACTELPAALMHRELLEAFPDALVILVARPVEDWIKSVKHAVDTEQKLSIWLRYPTLSRLLFQNKFCPNASKMTQCREFAYSSAYCLPPYDLGSIQDEDYERAKAKYTKHNEEVIKLCRNRKLLIFDLNEGWEPLCKFLSRDIPNEPFPMRNVKHSVFKDATKGKMDFDAGLPQAVMKEITCLLAVVVVIFMAIVYAAINYNSTFV